MSDSPAARGPTARSTHGSTSFENLNGIDSLKMLSKLRTVSKHSQMDSFKHSRKMITPVIFRMFLEGRREKETPQVIFVKSA